MNFEQRVREDLITYLAGRQEIEVPMPECPDVDEAWRKVGEDDMPDGIREFAGYPIVSLAWMMYTGMAVAKYWDTDWQLYSQVDDLYKYLRDQRDFDHMDDYICENVLLMRPDEHKRITDIVGECASRTHNLLFHQHLQPGTREAFLGYVAAIHQMYLMGMAMQLKAMGYHMTKIG